MELKFIHFVHSRTGAAASQDPANFFGAEIKMVTTSPLPQAQLCPAAAASASLHVPKLFEKKISR